MNLTRVRSPLFPVFLLLGWLAGSNLTRAADPAYTTVDQGTQWTPATRAAFYTGDQGSQMIPWTWLQALRQTNGQPFLADSLSRYGYLPNENSPDGLPVGFVKRGTGTGFVGLTCAACHTRQIEVGGTAYRIDGGPAIVDFQSFFTDLVGSVGTTLTNPPVWTAFAQAVLGPSPTPTAVQQLKDAVQLWYGPLQVMVERALPTPPWGPARLDAVGMIFNRVTGMNIGPPPSYLIVDNIHRATAPVRYPFLWNSTVQDITQWPGFTANGSPVLGLGRNTGEVLGVFSLFHPANDPNSVFRKDYSSTNTVNYTGLFALERMVRKIGPPQWPWPVNASLAATGKTVFNRPTSQGGCIDCHGIKPGQWRAFQWQPTWATPMLDVGTDSREILNLGWVVQTGVMEGAMIPWEGPASALKSNDLAFRVLGNMVIGSIVQWLYANPTQWTNFIPVGTTDPAAAAPSVATVLSALTNVFPFSAVAASTTNFPYESRVLQGVWAAAPYLHNGSVPTLAELLKPAAQRVAAFPVGPAYDTVNIGLATNQTRFNFILQTTDSSDRSSGNSRAGHEYGTDLPASDKSALLEYLKTL